MSLSGSYDEVYTDGAGRAVVETTSYSHQSIYVNGNEHERDAAPGKHVVTLRY